MPPAQIPRRPCDGPLLSFPLRGNSKVGDKRFAPGRKEKLTKNLEQMANDGKQVGVESHH